MKKLLLFFILVTQAAFAQNVWTVKTVPNTRLESDYIHVSDPDGYLSDSAELYINRALDSIRSQADVFLVTLFSIGDAAPKPFATRLFNYWGIGDAETDNGVLLLFVEDQHALEFETGYGAEEVLTDARCARIFNNTIVPYFRNGDYEGGLCAGVIDIVEVYGGEMPAGLLSRAHKEDGLGNDEADGDFTDSMSAFGALFFLCVLLPVPIISFFRWLAALLQRKKEEEYEKPDQSYEFKEEGGIVYAIDEGTRWKTSVWKGKAFKRFLLYGVFLVVLYVLATGWGPKLMPDAAPVDQDLWMTWMVLLVYLTVCCVVQNVMLLVKAKKTAAEAVNPAKIYDRARNDAHGVMMRVLAPWVGVLFGRVFKKREKESVRFHCPTCGADMTADTLFRLPEMRLDEQSCGAYQYTPCRCPSGHVLVFKEKGPNYSKLRWCKTCQAHVARRVSEKTVQQPTYTSEGLKEITYECMHCHQVQVENVSIAKLRRESEHSSSRSSWSHHSSSRSSGSFGGGRSGGGGYSGRW